MPRAYMLLSKRFWLVLVALVGSASPALGFERQWHLGGGGGVVLPPGEYSMGPALAAHAAYGISDVFDLRLELLGSRHTRDAFPNSAVLSGTAGIAYKLDIIEWVPYGGVLGGYLWSDPDLPSEQGPHRSPTLGFIVGVDYGFSRSVGVGAAFRQDFMLSGGGSQSAFLLRVEYRWGW